MSHDASAEISLLILKPDGYRLAHVKHLFESELEASGLKVVNRYNAVFSESDVLDIWPRFEASKFPLSAVLTRLYMTSGTSEVVVVQGTDVVARCVSLRRKVREQYGYSAVANGVHTPSEPFEVRWNVDKLVHCLPNGSPYQRPLEESPLEGIWGGLATKSREDLKTAAESMWKIQLEGGWEQIWRPAVEGSHVTSIRPGDPKSIDFGMSLLYEAVEDFSVQDAISAYLSAEIFGKAPVAWGSKSLACEIEQRITEAGLFADVDETTPAAFT